MKRLFSIFMALAVVSTILVGCGQHEDTSDVNVTTIVGPADGLDLKLVGQLLKDGKVKDAEGFEKELNKEGGINNLDLNKDGNVDYINVTENKSENQNLKSFDLTTGKDDDLTHIATIEMEKSGEKVNMNMSGNETLYGSGHHYHSSFSAGEMLFYAWLFSPRAYYYHPPYYHGYYPAYYSTPRRVVSHTTYTNRTSTQRQSATKSFTQTKTSQTKVTSPNKGKTSKTTRSSINAHNKQVKEMKVRNKNKSTNKRGFTNKSKSKSSTTRRSSPSRSRSFGGSRGGRRSDVNYKTDIVAYDNALATVMQLEGVYYYWQPMDNYETVVGGSFDNSRQVGFIAQDVEEVVPEVVETDEYGKVVNYDLLVPVLVEAIQDQQAQIDSLKAVISKQ